VVKRLAIRGPYAKATGSAKTVADFLQEWLDQSGVDSFDISYAVNLGGFEDIIKYLLPELRGSGMF
jgi:alkanesulfonate monooxygenase SsuD/methylene tetrahydromethanopterin reductase-like flavin-dependent oxidoreductase (luciferase family)